MPQDAMNKPWPKIVAHYVQHKDHNPAFNGLFVLVCRIEGSSLATGLFAWTSMWDLCITQGEVTYPYDGPYLRVSPMGDGKVCFRYIDTPDEKKQWSRIVDGSETVPQMLKFLTQLRWFPPEMLQ